MRPLASCLVTASLLYACGCGQKNEYVPPPPPRVTVARPASAVVEETFDLTGVTLSSEVVEVRARVEGILQSAPFTEGKTVKQGDLLFEIDPRPFQAARRSAQAAVSVGKANLASAQANQKQAETRAANDRSQYNRAARAAQSGAVTEAELEELRTVYQNSVAGIDVAKAAILSAEAEIAAAQANLDQAEIDLGYTKVHSPIDGRVGKREVDLGSLVGASEPTLLTTVVKYDPIYAEFTASEAQVLYFNRRRIERGDRSGPSNRENLKLEFRLGLMDEEGYPHLGSFDYAEQSIDQATGTFLVRGSFPNENFVIPSGAFVRLQVPLDVEGERTQAEMTKLLIPDPAICRDKQGAYVKVVNADNTVGIRRVELGKLHQGQRVITRGELQADDEVVVNGVQKAQPGGQVSPQRVEAAKKQAPRTPEGAAEGDEQQ